MDAPGTLKRRRIVSLDGSRPGDIIRPPKGLGRNGPLTMLERVANLRSSCPRRAEVGDRWH